MKAFSFQSLILTIIVLLLLQKIQAYDVNLSLQMAYMSAVSYQEKQQIDNWSCQPCGRYQVQNPKTFQNGSIKGFTGYSKQRDAIYIVFRGSKDIKSWVIDLQAKQVIYPYCQGCKVHSGFWLSFQTIEKQMNNQISELKSLHPAAKIYVTGHSLGGALSLLALVSIKQHYNNAEILTYVFGCPRVGNSQYAKFIENTFNGFRIIHFADIVSHTPPNNIGFKHAFKQVWYQQNMQNYQICEAQINCANSISPLKYRISDHNLKNYYLLIQGQRKWYKSLFNGLFEKNQKNRL